MPLPSDFWDEDPEPIVPPPSPVVMEDPGLDLQTKQQLLSALLQSPSGRSKLATSMTQPLRNRIDYQSIGHKTFRVEQLPDEDLPIYDKDSPVHEAGPKEKTNA